MSAATFRRALGLEGRRIAPGDTNYFVTLFEPQADGVAFTCVIEIFQPGGRTPPNAHVVAHEVFYVLQGEGIAVCDGERTPIRTGDALLVRPGATHVIENSGAGKLYTLTVMAPDEDFARLIREGTPVRLSDEDRAVLAGAAGPIAQEAVV